MSPCLTLRPQYTCSRQYTALFCFSTMTHTSIQLDAISMTMFMHNLSAGKGRIPSLLHEMSNSPTGDLWTILLEAFASLFSCILYLPSPIKTYGNTLRTEFGKITQEVWDGIEGGGMHAKVIDALCESNVVFFEPCSFCSVFGSSN